MTSDYSTEAQAVADAMNAVYENKQTNKKNNISGDFSSDNASYPTVKAVKSEFGTKVTSFQSTPSDSNYPSEKLVKDSLDGKQATLVSGTNIKTVNNQSLLGSGNVTIDGLAGNIVTSWESTPSDSKVPSEKLTKDTLDGKANSTHAHGNLTSDGKVGTNANYFVTTTTDGAVTSKEQIGYITTAGKLVGSGGVGYDNVPLRTNSEGTIVAGSFGTTTNTFCEGNDSRLSDARTPKSHTHGNISNDGKVGTTANLPLITTTGGAVTTGSFGTSSGQFAEGNHTHSSYAVTVEKQQTAETGYAHTYVIKQGGTALSPKINIPKDYLVKSGEIKTCTTANVPVQGYVVGDKYLDFVVNVKEGSATDEHIYILVKDLVDVYTADNSTLQLSNGQFSIKNGGVGSDQIASAVKSTWLSTSDVQSEIGAFAAALAEAINPSS